MGIVRVTPPQSEPVTLDEARAQARLTTNDEDGLLAGYILAAREYTENLLGRALLNQTFNATFDFCWPKIWDREHPRIAVELQRAPLVSVSSITYTDEAGQIQTLPPGQYRVLTARTVGLVEPVYGVTWPTPRWQAEAITVQFVAGYGSTGNVPEPIRQAILMLVAHYVNNREDVVIGGVPVTVPRGFEALIAPYRVWY